MISIELALRPSAIEHAPRAFLIPSDDPHLWIDILVESGCPALTTRLYAVPKSRQDPRPAAVLAAPPAGHTLRVPARALSYAAIADRLFFPADSTPYPPALPAELAAALT